MVYVVLADGAKFRLDDLARLARLAEEHAAAAADVALARERWRTHNDRQTWESYTQALDRYQEIGTSCVGSYAQWQIQIVQPGDVELSELVG